MKTIQQKGYLIPEIEVKDLIVERGFTASLESPEYDGEL